MKNNSFLSRAKLHCTCYLIKKTSLLLFVAGLFVPGLAGAHPVTVAQPAPTGYLQVFSSTQESQWGEGSFYYLHTGYSVQDSTGKEVKWVENHNSSVDETPEKVELAAGTYTIRAQSDQAGTVKIAVVVKPGRTLALHLENERGDAPKTPVSGQAVTAVCGKVAGWKA